MRREYTVQHPLSICITSVTSLPREHTHPSPLPLNTLDTQTCPWETPWWTPLAPSPPTTHTEGHRTHARHSRSRQLTRRALGGQTRVSGRALDTPSPSRRLGEASPPGGVQPAVHRGPAAQGRPLTALLHSTSTLPTPHTRAVQCHPEGQGLAGCLTRAHTRVQ